MTKQALDDLKPWPPSARHHHGFMRTGILWIGDEREFPVAYVDDQIGDRGRLHDQRRDEWMEWVDSIGGLDGVKAMAHPCTPIGCFFTFMAEVLAQAELEGVDTSIVTGDAAGAPTAERQNDIEPPAYQVQPHMTPPNVWTLTLNRYQRDNLLLLIQRIMEGDSTPAACFNTGDWVGEIRWMLGRKSSSAYGPGVPAQFSIDEHDHPNPVTASSGALDD